MNFCDVGWVWFQRLKFHLWSQVRVEGEQKVAELQAVVEELNGKLGTFTQVPQNLETNSYPDSRPHQRRPRRVRLPCSIIGSRQLRAAPQRPVSPKSLGWRPQSGMTSDGSFLPLKLRGTIWPGLLKGGSRRWRGCLARSGH